MGMYISIGGVSRMCGLMFGHAWFGNASVPNASYILRYHKPE